MSATLSSSQPAGERVRLLTENQGVVEALLIATSGGEFFADVADNDGTVAANGVVTHIVAVAGVLATDVVKSVSIPDAAIGSGITVIASVHAAGSISISYLNVKTAGNTNGAQTYRVFFQRP